MKKIIAIIMASMCLGSCTFELPKGIRDVEGIKGMFDEKVDGATEDLEDTLKDLVEKSGK